jgi:hypothetical protein
MTQLTKKQRQEKRRKDLNSLITFIKPVHKTLSEPIDSSSLSGAADSFARDTFVKKVNAAALEEGLEATQALLYEKLLMGEVQSIELSENGFQRDAIYFNQFSEELKAAGLFNRAKAIDLLLEKIKLVTNIKDVFVSKIAQSARQLKAMDANEEELTLLDDYKKEFKVWAVNKYKEDNIKRKALGMRPRRKTNTADSADKWLFKMAKDDLALNLIDYSNVNNTDLDKLQSDGTLFNSPEPPDNWLDFKLSIRFCYEQIKNN